MRVIVKSKFINKHPLDIWKSKEVAQLLADFFGANFKKAGLPSKMGRDYVLAAWNNRKTKNREALRTACDEIMLKAKEGAKNPPDEVEPIDLFDFSGVETFLDIGANKLATINHLAKKHKNIKKFIGVDTIPQRSKFFDPQRSSYFQVSPKEKSFPIKNESVDFINLQFVLHHFPDLKSIKKILAIARKILKPGGFLLIWEESFTKSFDPKNMRANKKLGIRTDKNLTDRFYSLSEKQRREFIIANDWLINVNNPHMPWTGQYYAWPEWESLLYEAGFYFKKSLSLGLRVNGRLKQGVHMIGVFKKFKISDGAKVFVKNRKTGKFLFVLRDNKPNILYPNMWGTLGGGIDKGESPAEALRREMEEESNVKTRRVKRLGSEKVVHIMRGEKYPRKIHYFIAETDSSPDKIKLHEGQKAVFFTLEKILKKKNISPITKKMIKKYEKEVRSY